MVDCHIVLELPKNVERDKEKKVGFFSQKFPTQFFFGFKKCTVFYELFSPIFLLAWPNGQKRAFCKVWMEHFF